MFGDVVATVGLAPSDDNLFFQMYKNGRIKDAIISFYIDRYVFLISQTNIILPQKFLC